MARLCEWRVGTVGHGVPEWEAVAKPQVPRPNKESIWKKSEYMVECFYSKKNCGGAEEAMNQSARS